MSRIYKKHFEIKLKTLFQNLFFKLIRVGFDNLKCPKWCKLDPNPGAQKDQHGATPLRERQKQPLDFICFEGAG